MFKYMILGLILCQILKQKTINIYRKGKEDREYIASFLMMKIQSHLHNNHNVDKWDDIIKSIYKEYNGKIVVKDSIKEIIRKGVLIDKIIPPDILVMTVINNKKTCESLKQYQ